MPNDLSLPDPAATLDHIGIAVNEFETILSFYESLGLQHTGSEHIADQGVDVVILSAGEARVELLKPVGEDTPVGKFISKRGTGLHHIAFKVADIATSLEIFQNKGFQLIDKEPRIGAEGKLIAFVHPKSTGGVLIELTQSV